MRVLIIEDCTSIRQNVASNLIEEGYVVDSSATGDEGLWYAENYDYDVIILDLMLPNINGITILTTIRGKDINTPVIIISARDTVDARIDGLNAGADDYLIKPFSLRELAARVNAQVRKKYDRKLQLHETNGLTIDFAAKKIFVGSLEVVLTVREYGLLEYLIQREGEVVSRRDIWTHVYQEHKECTSNAIDVYIGYLRKKIKAVKGPDLIETRRGLGYSIEK